MALSCEPAPIKVLQSGRPLQYELVTPEIGGRDNHEDVCSDGHVK